MNNCSVFDDGNAFYVFFKDCPKGIKLDCVRQRAETLSDEKTKQQYPSLLNKYNEEMWNIIAFPYGLLTLNIASSDFDEVHKRIAAAEKSLEMHFYAEELRCCLEKGIEAEEWCNKAAHLVAETVASCLCGLYQDIRQCAACYYILRDETAHKFMDDPSLLDRLGKCLPDVYKDRKMHSYIQSVLLREPDVFDNPLREWIDTNNIKTQKAIFPGCIPETIYAPSSLTDFLKLDIFRYLQTDMAVKRCGCCERLFIPKRKSEKYCCLPHRDTHLKCKDIAHRSGGDEFAKARDKARGEQHSSVLNESMQGKYDHSFLHGLYKDWSDECSKKCMEYKWHNDIDGFKQWIEETNLTAEAIAERYAQQQGSAASE